LFIDPFLLFDSVVRQPLRCQPRSEQRPRPGPLQGFARVGGRHAGRIQAGVEFKTEAEPQAPGRVYEAASNTAKSIKAILFFSAAELTRVQDLLKISI
jgi:hypothetical protein